MLAVNQYALNTHGLLVKLFYSAFETRPQQRIVIPDNLKRRAIYECHEGNNLGHPGFVRTLRNVSARFYWSGMYSDVQRYVQRCEVCQMHSRAPSQAPIAGHITADRPGQAWVIDVLHMLPSEEGHIAVLVAVDVFSRYCMLIPMYSIDSEETSSLLQSYILDGSGGIPDYILSDNGPEFKAEFDKLCAVNNITHRTSAPNHAQSHGMVERLIATTELTLAHFIDDDMTIWHKMLSHAQMAHNSTPHPSLSVSLHPASIP